jgi:Ni,Fe-hydrogenase III component G
MMLSEEELALIHAALDGELTVEQQRRLADLLSQSSAARKYYSVWRKFQNLLRGVDPPAPPAELPSRFWEFAQPHFTTASTSKDGSRGDSTSETAASSRSTNGASSASSKGVSETQTQHDSASYPRADQSPLIPSPIAPAFSTHTVSAADGMVGQRHFHRRQRLVSGFLIASVAFSLLIAFAWLLASFLVQDSPNESPSKTVVNIAEKTSKLGSDSQIRPHLPARSGTTDRNSSSSTVVNPSPSGESQEHSPPVSSPKSGIAQAPPPREAPLDIFTAPLPPPIRLDMAEIRLPFLRMLGEFDREDVQLAFLRQIQQEPVVRIDLFTRDLARAVQWCQKTAGQAGLHLFVDATTADRLKKGLPITAVLLYCDNLTPVELTRFFMLLNVEDAKISPRLFDMVHLVPLAPQEERDLRDVLGVDPGLNVKPRPDKSDKGLGEAPQRPLSAGTADEIIQSLLAKKGMDKPGLVTAWSPPAARTSPFLSTEIKSFLSRRTTRSPQAVPAVIILRLPNNP